MPSLAQRRIDAATWGVPAVLEVLAELAGGQRRYATVLGCSDSRVPPGG